MREPSTVYLSDFLFLLVSLGCEWRLMHLHFSSAAAAAAAAAAAVPERQKALTCRLLSKLSQLSLLLLHSICSRSNPPVAAKAKRLFRPNSIDFMKFQPDGNKKDTTVNVYDSYDYIIKYLKNSAHLEKNRCI